jgi:hypothetical protein
VQREVVIRIADRGRDGDDLAIGLGFGRGDRRPDRFVVDRAKIHYH